MVPKGSLFLFSTTRPPASSRNSVVWAQARSESWALPSSPLSLWRSLLGPGWLGFPSIVLGKQKGANQKMRLFQGIDSVTAMVQRGWGAVKRQRQGGPEQEGEAQETKWGPEEVCEFT